MGSWLLIQSYHKFGDPHISCIATVCPEEMVGKKRAREILWRIYSRETQFETLEEAEAAADVVRKLGYLQNPATMKPAAFNPKLMLEQRSIELPCGCLINWRGRVSTCEYWRRAGGALGFEERLFPKELYAEVRKLVVSLEWEKPKVWDRMERGVSLLKDLEIIAGRLPKGTLLKRQVLAIGTSSLSKNAKAPSAPPEKFAKIRAKVSE